MRLKILVCSLALVTVGALGSVNLTPPPPCYKDCLSNTLAKFGCSFADLECYCGIANTNFTGQLTGCVIVQCSSADQNAGTQFIEGVCAVLTSGQTILPPSLESLISTPTSSSDPVSTAVVIHATKTTQLSSSKSTQSSFVPQSSLIPQSSLDPQTRFDSQSSFDFRSSFDSSTTAIMVVTTKTNNEVIQTTAAITPLGVDTKSSTTAVVATPTTTTTTHSAGSVIAAIVGGIIGFVVLALIIMSVVLYFLVRRSIERRQARNIHPYNPEMKFYAADHSRSSVAVSASDTPEDEMNSREPTFWGVVTRPKQALRVVNG